MQTVYGVRRAPMLCCARTENNVVHKLSPAAIAAAADDNMVAHVSWVHRCVRGMHVDETAELVLVDCGLPCDTFNIVCRARLEPQRAEQRISAALEYFAGVQRPFAWWLGPADQPANLASLLEAAGLRHAESELAMAADLELLSSADLAPGGLELRRARTAAELHDYAQVVAQNWTPPDDDVLRFYELAAPFVLAEGAALWMYVGYLDGVPVAASELDVAGGVAGLYNVCTLEAYRRRGFASALTLRPLLDARDEGYRIGVLQASAGGAGVYARLGFEAYGEISEYKPA